MRSLFRYSTKVLCAARRGDFWRLAALALLLPILLTSMGRAQEPPPPTVMTDQPDYPPGATAIVSASGFQPGEAVLLQLWRLDGTPANGTNDGPWQPMADEAGGFAGSWMICQADCVGTTVRLTATGQSSGLSAQTTFSVQASLPSTYVLTDKSDYPPGSTAYITGAGFQPGETVALQVLHADGHPSTGEDHAPWAVVADASGAFQSAWHVCEDDCLGATLVLSAVGQASGLSAQTFFTDACPSGGGEVDLTFDPGSAPDNIVYAVARQPDGKVLIGGIFIRVNGAQRFRIARLNADGSTDSTFQANVGTASLGPEVYVLAVQSDGKVLVGGIFSTVNGVTRISVARLNTDGSLDTTFATTFSGVGPQVNSIAVQPDGKILIGGQFVMVGGVGRTNVARLNSDGTLDTTFLSGGSNFRVRSMALQADGKVLIGGDFTTVNGSTRRRVARLNTDGSLDATFQDPGVNPNSVNSIAVQPDGQVLIGGSFNTVNGVTRNRVARLNTDGSLDTTFQNAAGSGTVLSVVVQPDGKVLIGGSFPSVNSVSRNNIARLNSNGSLDTTFQNGMTGANAPVQAIALQLDGQVLIGGQFTTVNDVTRYRIARVNGFDGSLDTTFENGPPGPDDTVESVVVQSDGKVLIGGQFVGAGGAVRNRIARLDIDGSLDTTFQNGMTGVTGTGGISVHSVALQPDGKVLIGGRFSTVNGVARGSIARLLSDGSLDTTFQNGMAGANLVVGGVASVAVQPDGKVLIGGAFTQVNGTSRGGIARLNPDGSLDTAFQNGMAGVAGGQVYSVVVQSDGQVLIGGAFTSVNSTPRGRIARLNGADGSLDTTFQNLMAGANLPIYTVAVQSDGKVLIAGDFSQVNTTSRVRIARLNTDGSLDTGFPTGSPNGANSRIQSVTVQPDGKVLIGGFFNVVNGISRNRIARLNGDGSLDTTFQNGMTGPNSEVNSILVQSDGKVVIGGAFISVNGVVRERVARLLGSGTDTIPPTITCPANQVVSTDPGQCSAVVNYPAPTASDDCSSVTTSCAPPAGSSFPKGTTTVNCTATDASGNSASCSFTVTVVDNQAPVLSGCPASTSFQCYSQVPPTATVTANDNCDGARTVQFSETQSNPGSSCNNVITRTWTASDTAGNSASCTQTITVNDTMAPSITCPANTSVQCLSLVPSPDPSAVTTSDNCDSSPTVTWQSDVQSNPGNSCNNVITRTYRATDDCGNSATCTQTITVHDATPPTATCPPAITVQCMEQFPEPDPSAVMTSDNCDTNVLVLWESDYPSNGNSTCSNVFTRTYRAVDDCGNVATCTQTITVHDNMAPVLSGCPPPTASVQCLSQVPPAASVTASDNCDGSVPVQFTETQSNPGSSCNNVITRTWTATDSCGNSASCTQTITVNDTTPPSITCPQNITTDTDPGFCTAIVDYIVTASDNCGNVTPICDPPSGSAFAKGTTTVQCVAEDPCDSGASCSFTVTVEDHEMPTINCPPDATVQCDQSTAPGDTGMATASDNCPGVIVTFSDTTAPGACPQSRTITRTWTATDASDNTDTCEQTITVVDTTPPTITCPPNQTVVGSCNAPVSFTGATATDNCDPNPTVTCTPASGTALGPGVHTVNCTASDHCGNASSSCSFTVTVLAPLQVVFRPPLNDDNIANNFAPDCADAPGTTPIVNKFTPGQTIPHKVKIYDCAGNDVTTTLGPSLKVILDVTERVGTYDNSVVFNDVPETFNGVGDAGSLMELIDHHFQYNLKTTGYTPGTLNNPNRFFRSCVRVEYLSAPGLTVGAEDAILESR